MKRAIPISLSILLFLALAAGLVQAQGPAPAGGEAPQAILGGAFTYQGQLKKDGNLLDDTCAMRFELYDDADAGAQVGPPLTRSGVAVSDGLFTIPDLDFGDVFTGTALWLEVAVQCTGDADFHTLSPRQPLTAAPYALSLKPGARIVGTEESSFGLDVSGYGYGVAGRASSTMGDGVGGIATATSGSTSGVSGTSYSSEGTGVYAFANAPNGPTRGVYGWVLSTAGTGVYGLASAASGETYGVYGLVNSTAGRGVYGYAAATTGTTYGVQGISNSTGGVTYGVRGDSYSPDGRGVLGNNLATSGVAYGVRGVSASTGGRGVYGYNSATTGQTLGVLGETDSAAGYGVYGRATATNANWGVFAEGNIGGTGTKSAVVQTKDYGWRVLYAIESPQVLFEDVGTARLEDGAAIITIDPVFAQTANLEEAYQVFLTPTGDEFVLLLVTGKSASGFTVRGATLDGRPASCAFDYRIVARRLGYEHVRLAPAQDPTLLQGDDAAGEGQP